MDRTALSVYYSGMTDTDPRAEAIDAIMSNRTSAAAALETLYTSAPDPLNLMEEKFFTLTELQNLHERVLGHKVNRDQFRRFMAPRLVPTNTFTSHRNGRPAEFFAKP